MYAGWYRYKSAENVKEFFKASGMPDDTGDGLKDFRIGYSLSGDTWTMTELSGGLKGVNKYKLDEEFTYEFPGMPEMTRQALIVSVGTGGKQKTITKAADGRKEEWTLAPNSEGAIMTALEVASGQVMKICMERYINIYGDFKLITTTGCEKFLSAFGNWIIKSCEN